MDCTPQSLASAVGCYLCQIPDGLHPAVQTMLLAQIAHALAGTSTDPQTIAQLAVPYQAIGADIPAVQTYLLCAIATAAGA